MDSADKEKRERCKQILNFLYEIGPRTPELIISEDDKVDASSESKISRGVQECTSSRSTPSLESSPTNPKLQPERISSEISDASISCANNEKMGPIFASMTTPASIPTSPSGKQSAMIYQPHGQPTDITFNKLHQNVNYPYKSISCNNPKASGETQEYENISTRQIADHLRFHNSRLNFLRNNSLNQTTPETNYMNTPSQMLLNSFKNINAELRKRIRSTNSDTQSGHRPISTINGLSQMPSSVHTANLSHGFHKPAEINAVPCRCQTLGQTPTCDYSNPNTCSSNCVKLDKSSNTIRHFVKNIDSHFPSAIPSSEVAGMNTQSSPTAQAACIHGIFPPNKRIRLTTGPEIKKESDDDDCQIISEHCNCFSKQNTNTGKSSRSIGSVPKRVQQSESVPKLNAIATSPSYGDPSKPESQNQAIQKCKRKRGMSTFRDASAATDAAEVNDSNFTSNERPSGNEIQATMETLSREMYNLHCAVLAFRNENYSSFLTIVRENRFPPLLSNMIKGLWNAAILFKWRQMYGFPAPLPIKEAILKDNPPPASIDGP